LASRAGSGAVAEPLARPPRRKAATPAKPKAAPKRRTTAKTTGRRRARARGGVLWIAVTGALLAGVVFVNVAVLRLNLQLDKTNQQFAKLDSANHNLQSQLSSASASPRIQAAAAKADGLVQSDPSTITFIRLGG
jgi:cell division protein FtsL